MAKVTWAPGISTVSGALVKIDKKSPHAADQQMLLATHRKAPSTNTKCNNLYLRGLQSVSRSTPVTADEQAIRNRFAAVARAVAARKKDLAHVASDLAAFNAQKETGYTTLKSYLWSVCGAIYDQQNP
jgi:hypothetical protein